MTTRHCWLMQFKGVAYYNNYASEYHFAGAQVNTKHCSETAGPEFEMPCSKTGESVFISQHRHHVTFLYPINCYILQ